MSVLEYRDVPALPRADDQILRAVAVEVEPRHARAELGQRVRQEKLTVPIVERVFGMRVAAELGGRVLEQRGYGRGSLSFLERVLRGALYRRRGRDLIEAIAVDVRDRRSAAVAPVDDERRAVGFPHRERRLVVAVRHVEASDDDLVLLQRHGAAEQSDLRADGARIRRVT